MSTSVIAIDDPALLESTLAGMDAEATELTAVAADLRKQAESAAAARATGPEDCAGVVAAADALTTALAAQLHAAADDAHSAARGVAESATAIRAYRDTLHGIDGTAANGVRAAGGG